MTEKNSPVPRRGVWGWMFFDWAAQPFFTVVTTFIFGPYFVSRMASDPAVGQAAWGYGIAAAGFVIAILSPVLGSVADQTGPRKPWIAFFALIKIVSLSMLWFAAPGSSLIPPLIFFSLASIAAEFSIVFNDSMMPRLVSKAETLTYAIKTGDGPWYRYLVDLMLLSPLVLVLAIGGIFSQVRGHRAYVYLVAFVGFSYAIMCNIRYGMNLRYASIWDLPLRALAAAQVGAIASRFGARQSLVTGVVIAALCAYDLRQYQIFFVDGKLYELVTAGLLYGVKILK